MRLKNIFNTLSLVLGSLVLISSTASAAIQTHVVEYRDGDDVLEGYLAYEGTTQEKRPGILVVHEWRGLNDYAKHRAEQLAALGYVAFAADMYGKGVYAADHSEAAKLSGVYRSDRNLMRDRARAGLEVLQSHPLVNAKEMGAMGYCFGGTTVLEMARSNMDVKGVVSFHGGLSGPIPAKPGEIPAKVLVFHGAADSFVSPEEMAGFKKEMDAAGADYRIIEFEGAVHSFTVPDAGNDPSKGMAYNAEADEKSWGGMVAFFKELFKKGSKTG